METEDLPDLVVVIDNGILTDVLIIHGVEQFLEDIGYDYKQLRVQAVYLDEQCVDQEEEREWRKMYQAFRESSEYVSILGA